MAKRLELFRCAVCGHIVMVFGEGGGTLTCCGVSMTRMEEGAQGAAQGAAQEKHVPVIEKTPEGVKVKVGAVAHPMADDHYIRWMELLADGQLYCQFLNPGDAPEAFFNIRAEKVWAREYCNLHGYWRGERSC